MRKTGDALRPLCERSLAERKRQQTYACDPSLGALLHEREVVVSQIEIEQIIAEARYFSIGETQIVHAKFGQLVACAQPCQRQRRIMPCRDHKVQHRRQVIQQVIERLENRWLRDDVQIVDHQHKRG